MESREYKHGIDVEITTIRGKKSISFKAKTGYCEVTTPIKDIDENSPVLLGMLKQFFQPQLNNPIVMLRITSHKLLTPCTN